MRTEKKSCSGRFFPLPPSRSSIINSVGTPAMDASYRDRLRRLAARWNPSGVFIGDASAYAAVKLLRERPKDASVASLVEA